MIRLIHPLAGTLALLTISTFWLSTAASELFGTTEAVIMVKTAIPWGFLLLIPALAATGGSGAALAAGRKGGRLDAKRRRMAIAAAISAAVTRATETCRTTSSRTRAATPSCGPRRTAATRSSTACGGRRPTRRRAHE